VALPPPRRSPAFELPKPRWWRSARKAPSTSPERRRDRTDQVIDRAMRRGATRTLCGYRWAPCHRRVRGYVLLLCRQCDARPETAARLAELVETDWQPTSEVLP
jgi:hypothetical protein